MECQRCGKCCCEPIATKYDWLGANLTWKEKQHLLKEIKLRPNNDKGCLMLWFDGNIAHCLIWDIYGDSKLDINCRNYVCDKKK